MQTRTIPVDVGKDVLRHYIFQNAWDGSTVCIRDKNIENTGERNG